MRARLVAVAAAALSLSPAAALASKHSLSGLGSRSAALAQADGADARPEAAAYAGPTAAATRGLRLLAGYSYTWARLRFNDVTNSAPGVISGTDIGVQAAAQLGEHASLGAALALHLPDRGLARASFHAASEPVWLRFDAAPHRTTADAVLALRWRFLRVAGGAAFSASAGGPGVTVDMPQDARGPHADGHSDVDLAYRAAPIIALAAEHELAAFALRLRGASGVSANLDSRAVIGFRDNPLSGTTTVSVSGDAGYDPLTLDASLRAGPFGPLRAFAALTYERWRDAPLPIASYAIDLRLALSPFELPGRFDAPAYRDVLSPRVAIELAPPGAGIAARLGYALVPSALSKARGFLTPLDETRHVVGAGMGAEARDLWGIDLTLDAHVTLHAMPTSSHRKESLALPWATYSSGGTLSEVGLSLTGSPRR